MNKYNPNIHHRRSIRLKGYDYAQAGLYFITICVQNRECLFGQIVGANPCGCPNNENRPEMILNDAGKMIATEWLNIKNRFSKIELHEFVVMPNHFHGILEIVPQNDDHIQNVNINDKNGQSVYGQPQMGQSVYGQPQMGQSVYGQPQMGQSVYGQPQMGQPQMGQSVYGQPQMGQLQMGQSVYGQPQMGQLQMGQSVYGQPQGIAPTAKTVGDMMDAFKSITTVEYIRGVKNMGWPPFDGKLWQRNYYEHIIRNAQSYQNISNYIINNPLKWAKDKFYV